MRIESQLQVAKALQVQAAKAGLTENYKSLIINYFYSF
jgi:hypothetical protein